ncbi:MAG: transcription termination/antitermination protein NusA [Treponema sp.]|nr:MAG: transcription termination/antitermination protein NusA [Treponema sp.]
MSNMLSEQIRKYAQEKGFDDDVVINIIKQSLKTAYNRQYGIDSNVDFIEDEGEVYMVSNKTIVEKVQNPVLEISLEDAQKLNPESEIGDELSVEEDPTQFNFAAIQAGKQRVLQSLREMQKDTIYSEYVSKVGEIIIGYYHREKNGNIYVDLGKVEGILPKRFQSPRDQFGRNAAAGDENRIKALVKEVKKHKQSNLVQLVLSRTDSEFVQRILELEVPEIYNGVIEVKKIVRDAGNRTKVAVESTRSDIDPVGSCVGPKGSRIQVIIRELDGEKIDVIEYSDDPKTYIANALSPAEVDEVIILDNEKRSALAIVSDTQLSLAIGKQGLNVRLANRLVDWNIDVKTEEQFKEMDVYYDARKAAEGLFNDDSFEAISAVSELPGISDEIVAVLEKNEIYEIEQLLDMSENQIADLSEMTEEMTSELLRIISDALEVIDEPEAFDDNAEEGVQEDENSEADVEEIVDEDGDEEYYECPECSHPVTIDMENCPNCGIGLSFEFEDEDEIIED